MLLTVFVPPASLTAANGPTEFRLGSHRRRANDAKRLRQDGVAVRADAGDAPLFDYRVDHRGLANASDADRLVFFLALARPSFRDEKNAVDGAGCSPNRTWRSPGTAAAPRVRPL